MNSAMPTRPSLPTTAISAEAPSSITYSSEMMALTGKYTWAILLPDSYSTRPSGRSTASSSGAMRCHSGAGNEASSWLEDWSGAISIVVVPGVWLLLRP
ncbi:hypothetical protein Y695_04706 [Hydrogenophaga sp. T4]|nr:hypothetical protein Y695_04706 [Hydrogenophaga sp. T4]